MSEREVLDFMTQRYGDFVLLAAASGSGAGPTWPGVSVGA